MLTWLDQGTHCQNLRMSHLLGVVQGQNHRRCCLSRLLEDSRVVPQEVLAVAQAQQRARV